MSEHVCAGHWISNSGQGGKASFRAIAGTPPLLMHVVCAVCNTRTWLNNREWMASEKLRKKKEEV